MIAAVEALREYKQQTGKTNKALARELFVTEKTVRNWLKGRTTPPATKQELITAIIKKGV